MSDAPLTALYIEKLQACIHSKCRVRRVSPKFDSLRCCLNGLLFFTVAGIAE
ncbi:hypothetical protein M404DRAFT_1008091 [Pisolithus tinctorius Marx 270]|uniref:Uncharacterized protein n=1 Tax=Pisolithus tinctorius Marx 270 TaxID=870435 RepID=A0A0C3NGX2_PISTI|nr:hypothetical protein M404DRAFT_1008091 [Pisolithus tinctorius Marx 270]